MTKTAKVLKFERSVTMAFLYYLLFVLILIGACQFVDDVLEIIDDIKKG